MKSATLKAIKFPRKDLKLEDVIRLIHIDITSFKFDKDLLPIITDLRNHSKTIIKIGYDVNPANIRVILASDLQGITDEEVLDFISQFKIPHLL